MKSGLKDALLAYCTLRNYDVATIAAMKSGLKEHWGKQLSQDRLCSNHCPDEKDQATE